jgi:hypothetical protein
MSDRLRKPLHWLLHLHDVLPSTGAEVHPTAGMMLKAATLHNARSLLALVHRCR